MNIATLDPSISVVCIAELNAGGVGWLAVAAGLRDQSNTPTHTVTALLLSLSLYLSLSVCLTTRPVDPTDRDHQTTHSVH